MVLCVERGRIGGLPRDFLDKLYRYFLIYCLVGWRCVSNFEVCADRRVSKEIYISFYIGCSAVSSKKEKEKKVLHWPTIH